MLNRENGIKKSMATLEEIRESSSLSRSEAFTGREEGELYLKS